MKCRFIIMFLCKTCFKLSSRRCLSDIKNISFIYKNKSTPYTIHDFSSFISNLGFSLKENKNFDLCSWILNKCCLLLRRKITTLCDRVYQLLELEKVFLILCVTVYFFLLILVKIYTLRYHILWTKWISFYGIMEFYLSRVVQTCANIMCIHVYWASISRYCKMFFLVYVISCIKCPIFSMNVN